MRIHKNRSVTFFRLGLKIKPSFQKKKNAAMPRELRRIDKKEVEQNVVVATTSFGMGYIYIA